MRFPAKKETILDFAASFGGMPRQLPDSPHRVSNNASAKQVVDSAEKPLLSPQPGSTVVAVPPVRYTDQYAGLAPSEVVVLREQVETPNVKTSFFSAYRYATTKDKWLVGFAVFLAVIEGSIKAIMPILFGVFAQNFITYIQSRDFYDYNGTFHYTTIFDAADFESKLNVESPCYSSISNCTIVPEYISPDDFQRQANYDAIYFIYFAIAEFTAAYCSTFIFNDRGEVLAARIRKNYLASIMKQNMAYFDKLGGGEITTRISSDTMMIQDGTSEKLGYLISLASKYDLYLGISQKFAQPAGFYAGSIKGIAWLGLYLDDALVFWQGAKFLVRGELSVVALVTTLSSMVQGLLSITSITPHVRAVAAAISAINKIYTTIDRASAIDSSSKSHTFDGHKIDLPVETRLKAGATVALVGASGSGKSTIVGLIERFYNPVGGEIFLDGIDIEGLNGKWLRQQIGLVSEEPFLVQFSKTCFLG
ncbi:ABC transporter type 1, transmembrane domain-containing protein [Lipomyces mesembrius]